MQILKQLNKVIYFLGSIVMISCSISCNDKKGDCLKSIKDERTLTEYLVQKDTCDLSNEFPYHRYLNNAGLFMEGNGDRFKRDGLWNYYHKGQVIAKGMFQEGKPIQEWIFPHSINTEWELFEDLSYEYQIYVPKSWFRKMDEGATSLFLAEDETKSRVSNFNIVISEYDLTLSEYIKNNNSVLDSNSHVSEIDFKKLEIDGNNISEAYQRKFRIKQKNHDQIVFQTFHAVKSKSQVYILTINAPYDSYRRLEPFYDVMLSTFKIYY